MNHSSTTIKNITSAISPRNLIDAAIEETEDDAEEIHEEDANIVLLLAISLITCIMFSYWIKVSNIYYISER